MAVLNKDEALSWKTIFLDTSIIIDYLGPDDKGTPEINDRRIFTKYFIDNLIRKAEADNRKLEFVVSSITISELTRSIREGEDFISVYRNLFETISGVDVVYAAFTPMMAHNLNSRIHEYIPQAELNDFNKNLRDRLANDKVSNARQWIKDDYKIIATAMSTPKVDVVLSNDLRTFLEIANRMQIKAVPLIKSMWQLNLFDEVI